MLNGRALKFGDGISTDHIIPGRFAHLRSNLPELAKHVMEDADPNFSSRVKQGDFIVGGRNFGLGSSREHAPLVIKMAGIQGIEKCAVIDEAASGCVDQEGARLHGLELVLTEQTGCLFGQRHVETDEIGMAEQYIERHRSDLLFGRVYRGEIS